MARNPSFKLLLRFHWLAALAMFAIFGGSSADCISKSNNASYVFPVLESQPVGYDIFNVTANSVRIVTTGDNDVYKDWLNVREVASGFWEVTLQKAFDADEPDAGTVNFRCTDSPKAAKMISVGLRCQENANTLMPFGSAMQMEGTTEGADTVNIINIETEISVYLQILGANEFAPYFNLPDSAVSISESEQIGTVVYTVSACDPDTQPEAQPSIAYEIVDGDYGYFEISSQNKYTGKITLVTDLDYDKGTRSFVLNISATEVTQDVIGLTNYTTLTIDVTDVDDLMPEFINTSYTLSIVEGQYTGKEWFSTTPVLSARDGDYHINQPIGFRISKGSRYKQIFAVAENGSIAVTGSLNSGTYDILVEAYQLDKPLLRYVTTLVTIMVNDINDHAPKMGQPRYAADVSEAVSPGAFILAVSAVDEDVGNNSVIEFHLSKEVTNTFDVVTNGHNGVIVLRGRLDREINATYTFQVWAEETLTKEHTTSNRSQVVITVLDENDNAPQFTHSSYIFKLNRTQKKGDPIGQLSATDPDAGANSLVTYDIQASTLVPPAIGIDHSTGKLALTRNLTYSDVGSYRLTISATDQAVDASNRRSTFVQVTVNISSVNSDPPLFTNSSYTFYVLETASPGYLVGKITAADDDGDKVQYSLSGNMYSYFNLDSTSGELTVTKTPDLDDSASPVHGLLALTVNATDGQHVTSVKVRLVVLPVNEFPPKFVPQAPVTVFENETRGTIIAKVNATDADSGSDGNITFSLVTTAASDLFKVDPKTGEITLNCTHCLDSRRGTYDLIIQAKDGGQPPFSDTMTVHLKIQKTVFAAPEFTHKFYHVSLQENQPAQIVLQLSATDDDTPLPQLTFSKTSQVVPQIADPLIVVFPNGSVYINGSADAELFDHLVLNVTVSDGYSSDKAQVEFNITDENEFSPVLNITGLVPVRIPENATITQFVAAVGADDKDTTNTGFSYFLTNGADGKFAIDKTGIITVSGPLDRRLKSEYNITVSVFDHEQPQQPGYGTLVVEVTDSNSAPYFTNGSKTVVGYEFYVLENLNVGDLVGSLHADDPDSGSSGQFRFKLQSGDNSEYFSLDKDSGNLTLTKSLNYEEKSVYHLTVIVSDNSLDPKSATASVTVHVENVEEAPQWPLPLSTMYITQSSVCKNQQQQLQAFSQEVTTVSSIADTAVEYTLKNMTQEFSLDATSGLLKINSMLNEGNYAVWLRACNQNSTVCSDAVLTVVVQNKKTLAFCPTFYAVDVNNTAFVNFSFLDLNTTESDSMVSFNISAGNTEGRFWIGEHDGKLYVAEPLNRERTRSFILLISAEDISSHEFAEAQVIVRVLDVTNEAPQFSAATYHGEVLESQAAGSLVLLPLTDIPLVVTASEKDKNSLLTYSIDPASDNSNGSFIININGSITLVKTVDYETIPANFNKTYTFTVEVRDGVFTSSASVIVHVQDVNDNPPGFVDPADLVLNVSENHNSGQDLATVSATDPDTHTVLVYSVNVIQPTGASDFFYIDGSSGRIKILRDLDRESIDKYILKVTVSDRTFTISKTVTVNVLDVNDNSPVFNETFNMTVTEGDSGIGTNISVTASDADAGQNADVVYAVVSGNVNNSFVFDGNILKTVKALDKEAIVHNSGADIVLIITAVDSGQQPNSATGTVFVTITDIDDNPPQFSRKRYTAEVAEDAINITVTLTPHVELTDPDIDDCPGYLFSLSDNSTPFAVDKNSGMLLVKGPLDRETRENYTLQIVAIDNCGMGLNASAEIFIEILDVDDEPPYFSQPGYKFNISKNSQPRQSVGIVKATDVDTSGGFIVYLLSGSNMFFIDPIQGEIKLLGDLSSGNTRLFYLTVLACDSGNLQQCGNASVHISVTGICPVWNITSLNLTVEEGETGHVGYISALHDDLSNVSYFLNDTDGAQWLGVDISGEVTLISRLSADKTDTTSHMVSVYAKDYSQPNCSLPGTLTITVSGVNNNDPEICYQGHCGDPDIEVTIYDGSPNNSLVALLAARDNDTGLDGVITLTLNTITSGLQDLFTLKDTEIILQKQINLTDIKANSSIQNDTIDLLLTASDQGKPPRTTNTSVRVTVFAAQGDTLIFTNQTYFLDVTENEKIKTVVGNVTAKSSSPSSTHLEYSIYVPVGNVPFGIDHITGTISTTAVLDREAQAQFQFAVQATHRGQSHVSALALVVVNVVDVNESPEFDNSSITLSAAENAAPVDMVTLTARDDDEGSNGTVSYDLISASSSSNFAVNKSTGVLSVIQALDRENISSYDLVIQAVDGGKSALSATVAVHIIVTDTNDHAPSFPQLNYEYNITTTEPHVKVATITASDDDEGPNKDIIYSLESNYNTFKIDPLSGEIYSISTLSRNDYTLVMMAKDQGNPPLNSTVDVIIRLIDNQTYIVPDISLSTNFLSLMVGLKAGTQLYVKITTKDADSVQISGANGTTPFELQKDKIVLSQDLTQESVFVLIITATSATGHNVSQQLEIHVDRVQFSQQSYAAAVLENSQVSQTILDINSNAEKLGIPVIYSLRPYNSAFSIESTTGILWVQKPLDREIFSVYVLNVSVTLDPSVTSLHGRRRRAALLSEAFASVLVRVEDENDNAPSFDNLGSELHLNVPASVTTSYLITTLKAHDPDEGINGIIRYSLSGDSDAFELDPISGELRVVSPEKLGNHSTVRLIAEAADRNGTGSNVSLVVWIAIDQDVDQFRLPTPLSISVLNTNKEDILRSLSQILGMSLSDVRVTVHEESGIEDPSRSDIFFQAHQHTENTTTTMSVSQIQTQVSSHKDEIQKLLNSFQPQAQAQKKDDDLNTISISLITVACVMFVATLVAIFVSYRMWKKQKKYEKKAAFVRSTAEVKQVEEPKENDGTKRYKSLNSGDIELTILSEESSSPTAVTPGVTNLPDQYLQQVQESLQTLATESADSGIASPVASDSDNSGQDSPVAIQRNVMNDDDAACSAENTEEGGDGISEPQNEENTNHLLQKHTDVNVTAETDEDEKRTEMHTLEPDPTAVESSVIQEASSLTLPLQDSLSAVYVSVPPVPPPIDALHQNSKHDDLKQKSDNNIANHFTTPTIISSSTPALSFLNETFESLEPADFDSEIEDMTQF